MSVHRQLVELEAKAVFRGVRMSKAQRRKIATNENLPYRTPMAIRNQVFEPASRPGAVKGSKPSTARLRKAGVTVPSRPGLKRAAAIGKRRSKLAAAKAAPPKAARTKKQRMADAAWDRTLRYNRDGSVAPKGQRPTGWGNM
jgi:hypothetical protein